MVATGQPHTPKPNRRNPRQITTSALCAFAIGLHATLSLSSARAAEVTARDVTSSFFNAELGTRVNFAAKDLSNLDLANLDFKKAILKGADLYGVDLTRSDLTGADLSGVRLDRATIVRTNFTDANLSNVTILRPTTSTSMQYGWAEAAHFVRANLKGARIIAFMDGADFRGANLSHADFSPFERAGSQWATVPRSQMKGANFSGANLQNANLWKSVLHFAKFIGADLRGANFRNTDLSQADLSGANIAGADFTGAILKEAKFAGVKGSADASGFDVKRTSFKAQ